MFHVYKKGYTTLPDLKKINLEDVFEKNRTDSPAIQQEKMSALKNQKCFFEYNHPQEFNDICEKFLLDNYPIKFKNTKYIDLIKETDEDFLIHRIDGKKDYLSSAHVCFPSHWYPEDKIGKSFNEIHQPVPMNLKNSDKLVYAMVNGGIFERFVWSVVYEKKYNFHPDSIHKKFDEHKPEVNVKVERQVTVGFPKNNFCLFILRQYLIEEKDIDKKLLAMSIENMTPEQKKYKSLSDCDKLLRYLKI